MERRILTLGIAHLLTQRVNAKHYAIYCFYSVFSVNSVVKFFSRFIIEYETMERVS